MACIRSPKCSMAYRSPIVFSNSGISFIGFAPFELPAPSRSQMPWATMRRTFFCRKTQKCYTVFYAVCSISNICAYCIFFIKVYSMKKARKINLMGSSARVYIKTSFWEQISCVFRTESIFETRIFTCQIMLSLNHPCGSLFIESISF